MKNIVVLYHGSCPDGFAAAYAAWKKFGEKADYIPLFHGHPPPQDLEDKEVYMVDFSYPDGQLLALEKKVKRLVVLDHHIGAKDFVEAVQEHVFDNDRSGAGISWGYFHPDTPLPKALAYVQDNDLWRHALPHTKEVSAFLSTQPFDFEKFDALVGRFENSDEFADIVQKGKAYAEYFDYACNHLADKAEKIKFDEYEVLAVNAPQLFRSEVGHILADRHGPFAIVWYRHHGMWHFSLRGNGTVDLSDIAKRHGGGGHKNAASFQLPFGTPFPFTFIAK